MLIFTINQKRLLNSIGHLVYWATLKRWKRLLMLFYDTHHNFFFTPETAVRSRWACRAIRRHSHGIRVCACTTLAHGSTSSHHDVRLGYDQKLWIRAEAAYPG